MLKLTAMYAKKSSGDDNRMTGSHLSESNIGLEFTQVVKYKKTGWKKKSLMIIVLFGLFASQMLVNPFILHAQDAKTIHHYILLVKAKIINISDQGKIEQYVKIIRTALTTNPIPATETREETRFREGADRVSLVFFHFPDSESEDHKIIKGDYFYTSEDLISFNNLSEAEGNIRNFLSQQQGNFTHRPVSPVDMAENTVLPYLCSQYQKHNWPGSDQKVDKIILISIRDWKVSSDNFEDQADRTRFKGWQNDFNLHFKKEPLNKYIYNITSGLVERVEVDREGINTYIEYYKLIPQIDKNSLVRSDPPPALTRAAKRSIDGKVTLFWRGSSGILYSMDKHKGFLQWASTPIERQNYEWKPLKREGETDDNICIPSLQDQQEFSIQICKEHPTPSSYLESVTNKGNRGKFLAAISFRGVMDFDSLPFAVQYPFKYRCYTDIKKVDYFSTKSEEIITDDKLIKYLNDNSFCDKVIQFIKENKISNPYSNLEELKTKRITSLDAATVIKVRELIAVEKRLWIRNFIILLLVGLSAAGILLRYVCNPKINLAVEKDNENAVIKYDFSKPSKEKQSVALFELQNLRLFLSPKQVNSKFDLTMIFKIEHDLEENDVLQYNLAGLFTVSNFQGDKEYGMTQEADTLKVDLPDACAGDKFRLVMHPQEIEDLSTTQIEIKTIAFTVTLLAIHAVFKKNGKEVPSGKEQTWKPQKFQLTLVPQYLEPGVSLGPAPEENQTELVLDPGTGNYSIPYSANHPLRKLFKITVLNNNIHNFSETLQGKISGKAYEKNIPIDTGCIFYLDRNESSPETMVDLHNGYSLSLREKESAVIYCYLKFSDLKVNPLEPRIFQIRFYFNDNPIDKGHVNLTVTRSIEKTEALILISDQGRPELFENNDHIEVNAHSELVVHEKSVNNMDVTARFSPTELKPIKEYEPTQLFTLRLKNGCRTHTGYYEWRLSNIHPLKSESFIYEDRYKGEIITIIPQRNSGRIEDDGEVKEEITFSLNPKWVSLRNYRLDFGVQFTLFIDLIPEGKSLKSAGKKQLNVVVTCEGIHEVIPNYLVVDFGTSAIAAANSEFTLGPDSEKATNLLDLKSLKDHLPGENGLLPSIISLNDNAVIDSADFISLPALKDLIVSPKDNYLITSLKLLLLEGESEISLPTDFQYLDDHHNPVKSGNIKLESLLRSAYKQLRYGYIDTLTSGYKKLIFTCPNIYTQSHERFLSDLLAEVFISRGEGIYKENINLVSESDAVLYFYLKQKAGGEIEPGKENIVIFDIGGGTLDITLSSVKWEKDKNYPTGVEVKKKDGIALAGEVLDKAIALQVHNILKEYESRYGKFGTETYSRIGDELDPEKIFKAEEVKLPEQSSFLYYNRIVGDGRLIDEKYRTEFIAIMFKFKYEHILQFKKEMFYSNDNADVKICLGRNSPSEQIGMCNVIEKRITLDFGIEGIIFHSYLQSENEMLYLYLKKSEWLELPYLKHFKMLFKDKINRFFDSMEEGIQENITIILSGRTSLWPSIPEAIREVFGHEPMDIWKKDPAERALDLKRSVIEGAMQKVFYWSQIPYKSVKYTGDPAVKYMRKTNCWECKQLKTNEYVEIDLNNSPFFQLGIKTDLTFVPFIYSNLLSRSHYCKKLFYIRIHTNKSDNDIRCDFYIESDRYPENFCKVVPEPKSNSTISESKTLWPIKSIQLPDIKPEEFNELI